MAKHKVKRFVTGSEGETVGEAVGDSNEGMKEARDARDAYDEMQQRAKEEGAKISEGERISNMPASAKPVAPVKAEKAKVVTKAELEKSGMSLRDYLNKQQGLTRRESAKPAMSDAAALEKKRTPRYTPPGSAPKQSMGRQRQPFMPGDVDNSFPGAKFKDGGKVRSASARADGIAIRGKTRA
jgi:hypothetical protein